jgi:hypothetical protein
MTQRLPWVALALLAALPATASTVLPLTVDDLTDRADRVFHGICLDARGEKHDGRIVTRARFVVREGLKGAVTDTLDLLLPGGVAEGVRTTISGMPAFAAGQEVVLFLTEEDRIGRVWPVGLAQGGFRVNRDGRSARVRRDLDAVDFGAAGRPAAPPAREMLLDDLLDQVRRNAGTQDRR